MRKKQFKAESRKLLDMMINSIYTHKEIFLRELISNASDALDKLYFRSLTDDSVTMAREDYRIRIEPDKDARTLRVIDNGCGMTAEELEQNLGTIAKSGSLDFKKSAEEGEDVEIIGQFGVGFYAAFMVADKVTVLSKPYGADSANLWTSAGADGFTVEPAEMEGHGTVVTLYMKPDAENEDYSKFLETYQLESIVKKYSDYIRYPIVMDVQTSRPVEGEQDENGNPKYETVTEAKTLNSMIPLWRKNRSEITPEEYDGFYRDKFYDYEKPLRVIHYKTEGTATYDALLYIPAKAPFDYYTKDFEKGLQLYSNGVLIMDKCKDLLPDHFSFVRGLVDSADLSLNISREMLQHDYQLKLIAKTIDKKIRAELTAMLKNERETYEKFWAAFGSRIKYGLYEGYGVHKDELQDLVLFASSADGKLTTLQEYVDRMPESQTSIFYACGETPEKIGMLPQVARVKAKSYEILYFTDPVDEFAVQMLMRYADKPFVNVCAENLDIDTEDEKEAVRKSNEDAKDLLEKMKSILGDKVTGVRFTGGMSDFPACLTSEGMLSAEMEKVLNAMPGSEGVKAQLVLELSSGHPVVEKLASLDDAALADYTNLLYMQARLLAGMSVEDPAAFTKLISKLM